MQLLEPQNASIRPVIYRALPVGTAWLAPQKTIHGIFVVRYTVSILTKQLSDRISDKRRAGFFRVMAAW